MGASFLAPGYRVITEAYTLLDGEPIPKEGLPLTITVTLTNLGGSMTRVHRREKDSDKMRTVLGMLYPGMDVYFKIRNTDHGWLSGFWVWDMVEMEHYHTAKREVEALYNKPGEFQKYEAGVAKSVNKWRWVALMRHITREYGLDDDSKAVSGTPADLG